MPDQDDLVAMLLGRLLETEPVQRLLLRAEHAIERAGAAADRLGAPRTPPPTTPENRRARQLKAARRLLQFDPDQSLTMDLVRARRRELAKIAHPDKPGGSPTAMSRINRAADLLEQYLTEMNHGDHPSL